MPKRSLNSQVQKNPADAYREKLICAHARAEQLAEDIVLDVRIGLSSERDAREEGLHEMYSLMLDDPTGKTKDEQHDDEVSATQDAAWLLGMAVGRRLGGVR